MSLWFLLVGIVIGIAVAAPIGPVNVICIHKAMRNGILCAFLVGLGAAAGDTLFGAVAAFGLSTLSSALMSIERWLALGGAVILVIMGVITWRTHPHLTDPVPLSRDIAHGMAATFALTITNPMTALGFVALFTSVGFTRTESPVDAATIVGGVFLGSALWWLFISRVAYSIRGRLSDRHLDMINRGSAILIWGFALMALVKGITG